MDVSLEYVCNYKDISIEGTSPSFLEFHPLTIGMYIAPAGNDDEITTTVKM